MITDDSIGIDISKDFFDAHRLSDGSTACFPNAPTGSRALSAWLGGDILHEQLKSISVGDNVAKILPCHDNAGPHAVFITVFIPAVGIACSDLDPIRQLPAQP